MGEGEPVAGKHQDKIVLVTGANQPDGLGFAIARQFAKEGAAKVYITSRSNDDTVNSLILPGIREASPSGNCEAACIVADLGVRQDVEGVIDAVRQDTKRLDVLVNNAAVNEQSIDPKGSFFTLPWETMEQIVRVNLMAPIMLTRLAFDRRTGVFPREGGVVGNIGSITAVHGNMAGEVYTATKGGLMSFTRSAAIDLARVNSRIFTINGGFFDTRMTRELGDHMAYVQGAIPLKRTGAPEEMATVVVAVAGPDFSYFSGDSIDLDGGLGGGYTALGGLRSARLLAAIQA